MSITKHQRQIVQQVLDNALRTYVADAKKYEAALLKTLEQHDYKDYKPDGWFEEIAVEGFLRHMKVFHDDTYDMEAAILLVKSIVKP